MKAKPRHASHVSFTTAEGDQSEVEDDPKSAKSNDDGRTMAAPRGKKTPCLRHVREKKKIARILTS